MLPAFAVLDVRDGHLTNTEPCGNGAQRASCSANCTSLVISELRMTMGLSTRRSTLRCHVSHVGRACSKPQMGFVSTRRIVAAVTDLHPDGDRTIRQFPRQPRYAARLALPIEHAIPFAVVRSYPRPAGVGAAALVGVVVKTLGERPVPRAAESFIGIGSHLIALLWRSLVRAGAVLDARFQPAFSTTRTHSC